MSRGVGTLDSLRKDSNDPDDPSNDDDNQQSFYVGGGEHSGQQVLGGRDERGDIVANFFRAAQMQGARAFSPEDEAHSSTDASHRLPSSGYRLGDLVRPSEPVLSGDEIDEDDSKSVQRVDLRMWRNGFTVNDGPLRTYEDPGNTAFLNDIIHRVTPQELLQQYRGKKIDMHLERKDEPYAPPKASEKPFSGQGQRLGEIEPVISGSGKVGVKYGQEPSQSSTNTTTQISGNDVEKAQEGVQLCESEPTTQIQLRLPDGRRIIGRFNHTHTLQDVRSFVVSAVPELAFKPFNFMTTYPKKVIEVENSSLSSAGLLNSVILVKFV